MNRPVITPTHDPRYLQALILFTYAVLARSVYHFERTHIMAILCCLWGISLDLCLGKFFYKKPIIPLSAFIISLSCGLLIDARSIYPYLGTVTFAILSKTLVTFRGRHFFNPANFGVVFTLALFPGFATGMPSLFSGNLTPTLIFAVLGLATVVYARQMEISIAWISGFLVLGLMRYCLRITPNMVLAIGPALSPAFLLFSFHMITDPATTPVSKKYRIAFGFTISICDAIFRSLQIPNGMFYSLFFATSLMPLIRERELT